MEDLLKVVEGFRKKKILVIGDVVLDKYTVGSVKLISPEAPVPILTVEKEFYRLGGAGNVALNAANLSPEGQVYLFGFIGEDSSGDELRKILTKNITSYFEKCDSTTMKERIIGRSSGQQQQIVRVDREEKSQRIFKEKLEDMISIARIADIIIISDYAKGVITLDLMEVLNHYKEKIVADPKPNNQHFKNLYKNVKIIKPNREEALRMSGCYNIDDAGYKLREELNSNILITLGGEGMKLFPRYGKVVSIETIPEESFEETGAGDTAISAIALSLSSSNNSLDSLISAAKIGNLASGITIKYIGTYAPSFDELKEKISKSL